MAEEYTGLQFSTVMKGVLWAQSCQLGAQDLSDMFQTLRIDVIFEAVPVRVNEPATDH